MNLVVIQSEELIKQFENADNEIQFILKNYQNIEIRDKILIKEFESELEKTAYLQGIEDSDGWNKVYVIEDEIQIEEIVSLLKQARVYLVRDDFYQEDMPPQCEFRIFAGANAYERATFFLTESANARDTFTDFLEEEGDFRNKNLYWEIEEQTLEMWSAESINILESIQELGRYAEIYGELDYKEREVDYGVTAYSFEKSSI